MTLLEEASPILNEGKALGPGNEALRQERDPTPMLPFLFSPLRLWGSAYPRPTMRS